MAAPKKVLRQDWRTYGQPGAYSVVQKPGYTGKTVGVVADHPSEPGSVLDSFGGINPLFPPRAAQLRMTLPGVGGPASVADVVATNAAAAKAAAAAVPFIPKKTKATKKTVPPAGGTGGGGSAPAVTPAAASPAATSDGTYDWWHSPAYYEDQARSTLSGDIQSTRDQYDREQAALQAQQAGAAKLLSDFGKSVSQYYSDAATKAGQGFDTRAAAQALLGAVGQRAFTGQSDAGIAANLAAAGNPQLGQALASEGNNRNAVVGAILNRIIGTDPARTALAESSNATQQALGNVAAQNKYGQRLLAGLSVQQQNALNELLGKRADFETKLPSIISQRALEMQNAAYKNMLAQQAFGLKVDSQKSLDAYRAEQIGLARDKLVASADAAGNQVKAGKVGDASKALTNWASGEQKTNLSTGKSYVTRPPLTYQDALKKAKSQFGAFLTEDELIQLANAAYPERGVNGRPYLSATDRRALAAAGYDMVQIQSAIWNRDRADALLRDLAG